METQYNQEKSNIYYQFDENDINTTLKKLIEHYRGNNKAIYNTNDNFSDDGIVIIEVAKSKDVIVVNNKVCLELPFGLYHQCIIIPSYVPHGSKAKASIYICSKFEVASGVQVTITYERKIVARKSFGLCMNVK